MVVCSSLFVVFGTFVAGVVLVTPEDDVSVSVEMILGVDSVDDFGNTVSAVSTVAGSSELIAEDVSTGADVPLEGSWVVGVKTVEEDQEEVIRSSEVTVISAGGAIVVPEGSSVVKSVGDVPDVVESNEAEVEIEDDPVDGVVTDELDDDSDVSDRGHQVVYFVSIPLVVVVTVDKKALVLYVISLPVESVETVEISDVTQSEHFGAIVTGVSRLGLDSGVCVSSVLSVVIELCVGVSEVVEVIELVVGTDDDEGVDSIVVSVEGCSDVGDDAVSTAVSEGCSVVSVKGVSLVSMVVSVENCSDDEGVDVDSVVVSVEDCSVDSIVVSVEYCSVVRGEVDSAVVSIDDFLVDEVDSIAVSVDDCSVDSVETSVEGSSDSEDDVDFVVLSVKDSSFIGHHVVYSVTMPLVVVVTVDK